MLRYALLFVLRALSSDPACQPVIDAAMAQERAGTYRLVVTMAKSGGATQQSEQIVTPTVRYVRTANQPWMRLPETSAERIARARDEPGKTMTCHLLRSESVGAEAARVYEVTTKVTDPVETLTAQTWISVSRNLPLRIDSDADLGSGTRLRSTTRFEYGGNIQPPVVP